MSGDYKPFGFNRTVRVAVADVEDALSGYLSPHAANRLRHAIEHEHDRLDASGLPGWVISFLRRLQPGPGEGANTYAQFNRTVTEFADLYNVNEMDAFKAIRDHHVCQC